MPTGYTASIKDGITFEQFVIGCARAFGALIMMRDEPSDAPIPEQFEPSDYHLRKLSETKAELAELTHLSPEACEHRAALEYHDGETRRLVRLSEISELRLKYEAMLDGVNEWVPPSDEHRGLQAFMRQQITESINFDCEPGFYAQETTRYTGERWLELRREKLQADIAYHEQQHAEEVERTNQRNEWIRLLRESLA